VNRNLNITDCLLTIVALLLLGIISDQSTRWSLHDANPAAESVVYRCTWSLFPHFFQIVLMFLRMLRRTSTALMGLKFSAWLVFCAIL